MDENKNSLLYVDDEAYFSRRYRDALRERFNVTYLESADEAAQLLQSGQRFDAMVLDVMMPPPPNEEEVVTGYGYETGTWLLSGAERGLPGGAPPTVLLTNRGLDLVCEDLRKRNLDPDDVRFELCFKADTSSGELPGIVGDLLTRQR